jgi:ribonuclease Z
LGLPGLLSTLALSGYNKTLFIYGPKGTKNFIKKMLDLFKFMREYEIKIEEVEGKFFETDDFLLQAESMTHGIPCNAYSFVKKSKIRIDKEKLKKSKLPEGPLLQEIKKGKNVVWEKKKYLSVNKKIVPFVKNSVMLVCESTFGSELEGHAKEHGHLTSKQAGEIAKKSKSEKLFLVHVSARYGINPKIILEEAKENFENSFLARDLDVVDI